MTFLTQPQDVTVVKGGDATFQCAEEENGTALLLVGHYPSRRHANDSHHWYSSGRSVDGNDQWRPDAADFEWGAASGGRGRQWCALHLHPLPLSSLILLPLLSNVGICMQW